MKKRESLGLSIWSGHVKFLYENNRGFTQKEGKRYGGHFSHHRKCDLALWTLLQNILFVIFTWHYQILPSVRVNCELLPSLPYRVNAAWGKKPRGPHLWSPPGSSATAWTGDIQHIFFKFLDYTEKRLWALNNSAFAYCLSTCHSSYEDANVFIFQCSNCTTFTWL